MSKSSIWFGLGLLVLLLAGCGQAPTATSTSVQPQEPTQIAAPTATAVAAVNYCIECHTDKDQLIQTAKPEEEVESESEGVG